MTKETQWKNYSGEKRVHYFCHMHCRAVSIKPRQKIPVGHLLRGKKCSAYLLFLMVILLEIFETMHFDIVHLLLKCCSIYAFINSFVKLSVEWIYWTSISQLLSKSCVNFIFSKNHSINWPMHAAWYSCVIVGIPSTDVSPLVTQIYWIINLS